MKGEDGIDRFICTISEAVPSSTKLGYSPEVPLDPAIKSLISQFRKSPAWDEHLDLELLQKLWPALVGEQLASVTRIITIQGSRVVLDVPDRVWRKQLYQMKGKLLHRINEPWGTQRITEIAFTYENQ
jgi:predicted nucleic acid-binding Zn ribbon protein